MIRRLSLAVLALWVAVAPAVAQEGRPFQPTTLTLGSTVLTLGTTTTSISGLTLVAPVLGTPLSANLSNATALPISTGVSGLGTGVATFLGTPTSANLIAALTDETGTGAAVFANTPTLVTPNIGAATGSGLALSNAATNAQIIASALNDLGNGVEMIATGSTYVLANTAGFISVGTPTNFLLATAGATPIHFITGSVFNLKTLSISSGSPGNISFASAAPVGWASANGSDTATDTSLSRCAAGLTCFGTGAAASTAGNAVFAIPYTYSQPATGNTVAMTTPQVTEREYAVIEPAGTLATLTITLPACNAAADSHIAGFSSTQIVTALTVGAASGTVVDGAGSLAVGGGNSYICRGSTTKWYRL